MPELAPDKLTAQMRLDAVLPYDSFAYLKSLTHFKILIYL